MQSNPKKTDEGIHHTNSPKPPFVQTAAFNTLGSSGTFAAVVKSGWIGATQPFAALRLNWKRAGQMVNSLRLRQ
jgi:hypothetical protein